ncbi:phytanoyl-CoA dioxygenase family protein [Micromonospora sp. NPDC049559]|uniref:phytanoyl-CoA dioxygenase family protein n=1 Tax=Micromonospora sp. NPDC049559 TaxID=3155923 RepID=UPI0034424A68
MTGVDSTTFEAATEHFREHGYVIMSGFLDDDYLRPIRDDLHLVFPTAEEYHDSQDPELRARFAGRGSAGINFFPFASTAWSLLGVSPPIVGLAEALLGTSAIRLYELHNWGKYTGAASYEQDLHRDYGNHTMVVPSEDWTLGAVGMFIYLHDVPETYGPTHVVSQTHTGAVPPAQLRITKDEHPEIYAKEVSAAGPAGTVLAYRNDTFHRGTSMTVPRGARFALKLSYRAVGDAEDVWIERLGANIHLGLADDWYSFVNSASHRQLELVGFPPRGHRYWTKATWAAVCQRYPNADLSAFKPEDDYRP